MIDFIIDGIDSLSEIDLSDITGEEDNIQTSDFWDAFPEPDESLLSDMKDGCTDVFANEDMPFTGRGQVSFGSRYVQSDSCNNFNAWAPQPVYPTQPLYHVGGGDTYSGHIDVFTDNAKDACLNGNSFTKPDLVRMNSLTMGLDVMTANYNALDEAGMEIKLDLPKQILEINKKYGFGGPMPHSSSPIPPVLIPDTSHIFDDQIQDVAESTPGWDGLDIAERFDKVADKISSIMDDSGLSKVLKNPSMRAGIMQIINHLK